MSRLAGSRKAKVVPNGLPGQVIHLEKRRKGRGTETSLTWPAQFVAHHPFIVTRDRGMPVVAMTSETKVRD